jgi:hypothetical protein
MLKKEMAKGIRLIIEIAWGTMLFLAIAAIALAAHKALIAMFAWAGATGFIVSLLTAAKYGILALDLVCFVTLMVRAAIRFVRKED